MHPWTRAMLFQSQVLLRAAPKAPRLQQIQRPLSIARTSLQRPQLHRPPRRKTLPSALRSNSTQAATSAEVAPPKSTPDSSIDAGAAPPVPAQPIYAISFTCRPCGHRSTHQISQRGYHHGSVLISCPGCKSRHVISDHLRIFSEEGTTLEQLLAKHGEVLKTGTIDEDGDIEIWDDGTSRYVRPPAEPKEDYERIEEPGRHKPVL